MGGGGYSKKLSGTKRNQRVFQIISERMKAAGVIRSAVQCRVKIKSLKTEYKKVVDNNKRSGRGKKTFKYFSELDQILKDNPGCRPEYTFDSTTEGAGFSQDISSSDNEGSVTANHKFCIKHFVFTNTFRVVLALSGLNKILELYLAI